LSCQGHSLFHLHVFTDYTFQPTKHPELRSAVGFSLQWSQPYAAVFTSGGKRKVNRKIVVPPSTVNRSGT
jgi:hypothetical protein